jgi:thiol-disulfide isomerase/thioredoxin
MRKSNYLFFSVIALVIVAALGYVQIQTNSTSSGQVGVAVSPSVELQLKSLSSKGYNLIQDSYGSAAHVIQGNKETLYDNKPVVIFVGAEWCPYCGAEMWSLILALDRFGNVTGLEYMLSSSTDVYPNTPTFTLYKVNYSSPYISLLAYEYQDRNHNSLQSVPSNIYQLWNQYTGGGIPFIYVAGLYYDAGSTVNPGLLSGSNWTYIINTLSNDSNSPITKEIYYTANLITAEICEADGNAPASVCSQQGIMSLESYLGSQGNVSTYFSNTQVILNLPSLNLNPVAQYTTTLSQNILISAKNSE